MHRQTKKTAIPKKVKEAVWERDEHRCVLCGSPFAAPVAHFIARSQGGLGVEQNVVTLCEACHYRYDNTHERHDIRTILADYLKSKYRNWSEEKLVYKKYR